MLNPCLCQAYSQDVQGNNRRCLYAVIYAHSIFMCQKARQIRRPYYTSIASAVQTEKAQKIRLSLEPPAKRKKIGTGKSKALADAVGEEVDILCGLDDSNNIENHPSTDVKRGPSRKLQPIDEMLLVLYRLRCNVLEMTSKIDLVDSSTISRILTTWINTFCT